MIRVHVICEGQTEEMFINEVVSSSFAHRQVHLSPSLIGRPGHKGGNFNYQRLLKDLEIRLLGDRSAFCTTFFDFYGLPQDFPGKEEALFKTSAEEKAECIQHALCDALLERLGRDAMRRFVPYIQMYEFEGLLFSDPVGLAKSIGRENLSRRFQDIRDKFATPEDINNSPVEAPSKRICKLVPGYDKPVSGSLAALEVGLDAIRQECSLFNHWLGRLELLADH